MVDVDAIHPKYGYISTENTPAIAKKFLNLQTYFEDRGLTVPASICDGYLDSSACSKIIADKMGLDRPQGSFTFEEYSEKLLDSSWENDHLSTL